MNLQEHTIKRKGGQYFKLFALIVYTIDVFKNPHNIFLSVGDSFI